MPDSVPNYLQTLANGDVRAIFPGGVQIDAGTSDTPPSEQSVTWVRQSDGALVADIAGAVYDVDAGGGNLLQVQQAKVRTDSVFGTLEEAAIFAQIWRTVSGVIQIPTQVGAYVKDNAGATHDALIVDEADASSFAQLENNRRSVFTIQDVAFDAGPLPTPNRNFTAYGTPTFCIFGGSGFVNPGAVTGAFGITVDGAVNVHTTSLFFNNALLHLALPTRIVSLGIKSAGNHTLRFDVSQNLQTNGSNAFFAFIITL